MDWSKDGVTLHYEKSGQGYPVVLLHGWGCSSESFHAIAQHLAPSFTVYNLDLPGFGQSTPPPEPWDTGVYTQFIEAFLTEQGIQQPILIAHSFGGRLSLQLGAKKIPKKMVLTGCAGLKPKRGLGYYVRVYSYKAMKQLLRLPFFNRNREEILERWRNKKGSSDYQQSNGVMRQVLVKAVNEDLRGFLPQIACPVLLFWGADDTATPLWLSLIHI